MKILITSFTYPPNKDGVSEATRSMAAGLASMGHEVSVATSHHRKRENKILNDVKVTSFNLSNSGVWIDPSGVESDRFIQFVKNTDPDILINHCWDAWPAVLSQKIFNDLACKKIQISHGFSQNIWTFHFKPFFGLGQLLKGLLWTVFKFPRVAKSYDAIAFLSNYRGFGRFLDQTICRWMMHPCMHVIPNSVEENKYTDTACDFRTKYNIGDRLMVLCVANYSDGKNQKLAVRAFRKSNILGSTLVFIGSEFNKYSEKVMKLDKSLGRKSLCRTIFLEGISREETQAAFACCDLFLLTSKRESQPIVLIESMAAGKPWIATVRGCISTMEGGIPVNSMGEIVTALQYLMTDSAAAAILGKKGKTAYESRYSPSVVKQLWKQLIEEFPN